MTQGYDDFSVEKPDIERNLRAVLFEREAEIERLRAERDELKSEQIDLRLRITELELLVALKKITP